MDKSPFLDFVDIIRALRHPETGCPWDLKQTHQSLRPYLIEESYEVLEAIEQEDDTELCSELGDVLLQVVLHAQLASERKAFTIEDVIQAVSDKMIRRHPHVFSDGHAENAEQVIENWEQIKQKEKEGRTVKASSSFDSVPRALPALHRAHRIGDRAAQLSFDWDSVEGVWEKVEEEIGELKEVLSESPTEKRKVELRHELGDVLFSLCQLARWLEISPEDSLSDCCNRFLDRFIKMEELSTQELGSLGLVELEKLWEQAKSASGS